MKSFLKVSFLGVPLGHSWLRIWLVTAAAQAIAVAAVKSLAWELPNDMGVAQTPPPKTQNQTNKNVSFLLSTFEEIKSDGSIT